MDTSKAAGAKNKGLLNRRGSKTVGDNSGEGAPRTMLDEMMIKKKGTLESVQEDIKIMSEEMLRQNEEIKEVKALLLRLEKKMDNNAKVLERLVKIAKEKREDCQMEVDEVAVSRGRVAGVGQRPRTYLDIAKEVEERREEVRARSRERQRKFFEEQKKKPLKEREAVREEIRKKRVEDSKEFANKEELVSEEVKKRLFNEGVREPLTPEQQVDVKCFYIGLRARPYKIIKDLLTKELKVPITGIIGMNWVGREILELLVRSDVAMKLERVLKNAGVEVHDEHPTEDRFLEGKAKRLTRQMDNTYNQVAIRWYDTQYKAVLEKIHQQGRQASLPVMETRRQTTIGITKKRREREEVDKDMESSQDEAGDITGETKVTRGRKMFTRGKDREQSSSSGGYEGGNTIEDDGDVFSTDGLRVGASSERGVEQ